MRKDARVWINSGYDGGRSSFGAGHLSVLELSGWVMNCLRVLGCVISCHESERRGRSGIAGICVRGALEYEYLNWWNEEEMVVVGSKDERVV